MPDQTAIDSALETVIETELGSGIVSLEAEAQGRPAPGKALLVYNGYSLTRLPYRQDLCTYEYVLLYLDAGTGDSAAERDTVSDSLEAIREALRTDAPTLALVHDVRVSNLRVENMSGEQVLGAMTIEAEVIK